MAESSKPWDAPVGGTQGMGILDSDWWYLWGDTIGEGLLADTSGAAGNLTAPGSGTVATLAPLRASVRGFQYLLDASKTFDVAASGTQPTGSQSRVDRIVLKLDPSATTISTRIQAVLLPGTPGASPTPPNLTRTTPAPGGLAMWMVPLWQIRRAAAAPISSASFTDERSWIGSSVRFASEDDLPTNAPIGTTAVVGYRIWTRMIDPGTGSIAWVALTDPDWTQFTPINPDITFQGGNTYPSWRINAGRLELKGRVNYTPSGGGAQAFPTLVVTVAQLPVGSRPNRLMFAPVAMDTPNSIGHIEVSTTGAISICNLGTAPSQTAHLDGVSWSL